MQKNYTPNFLTGKKVKNRGMIATYLIENAHEPIIDQKTFDRVQEMKGWIRLHIVDKYSFVKIDRQRQSPNIVTAQHIEVFGE